ncbi:MAG TPA: FkbM family methyltransferase [Cryomorphaceae bacterium]|nr:FkbM family methyltransferase [Cryomorphaceae bacterium]
MKNVLKRFLQQTLGFNNYLRLFARYKVSTLKGDTKEGDFFHFMSLLKDEGTILDIGANLGIMTWHLLNHFNHAKVWAFEPIPSNLEVLRKTTEKFDPSRLRIFENALGHEAGRIKMVLPEVENVKMQGLSHVVHETIDTFNEGQYFEVDVEKLDSIVDQNVQVVGVKLDVENFEYFVLKGGEALLRRDKPIIYTELWENDNRQKCMEFLNKLDYETFYFDGVKLKPFTPDVYSGQNFFFLSKGF